MKIKGLIFDLDGVLVDTKKIHFDALNIALKSIKFEPISFKDHINIYDGLPTLEKLKILKRRHGLNKKFFQKIQKIKQIETQNLLGKNLKYNPKIFKLFSITEEISKPIFFFFKIFSKFCFDSLSIDKGETAIGSGFKFPLVISTSISEYELFVKDK